jgi:hypothetical protein
MASQRHKLLTYNYGATCYTFDEKAAAIGYIRQQPGPYVQPTGPAGGPLKGSTLSGPPPASLPGPLELEHPALVLGLILAGSQRPPDQLPPDLPAPTISSLEPDTAELGSASFTLHVKGTGFWPGSMIVFNGGAEQSELISPTELTTGINMATAETPGSYPVLVHSPDGKESNVLEFTFTEAAPVATKSKKKKGS